MKEKSFLNSYWLFLTVAYCGLGLYFGHFSRPALKKLAYVAETHHYRTPAGELPINRKSSSVNLHIGETP